MKKLLFLFGFGFLVYSFADAQNLDREVFSSAGTVNSNEILSLEWTLGELATASVASDSKLYTQGFHQPYLKVEEITKRNSLNKVAKAENEFEISIYPNPAHSSISVEFNGIKDCKYELRDVYGKLITREQIDSELKKMKIDLSGQPDGLYLITFFDNQSNVFSSNRIIKIQ